MKTLLYRELTYKIIGAAREVFHELGSGYLESVYEDALCYELDVLGIPYQRQIDLDVRYKNVVFERRFRADLLIQILCISVSFRGRRIIIIWISSTYIPTATIP